MKFAGLLSILLLPTFVHAQELTGTLAHINETGEITIGYRTSRPPVSYADDAGVPNGYSVEICKEIAADVGKALGRDDIAIKYKTVTAQDRFDAVETGAVDILCGATTKTLSRSERVGFSQLTFVSGGALLSQESDRVDTLDDIKGRPVAVVSGATTEKLLQALLSDGRISAEVVSFDTAEDGMEALNKGDVAALASDQIVLIGQVLSRKDTQQRLFLSNNIFSFEPYALAIKRGDADFALVADRTISRLFRTGQVKEIYNTHFGAVGLTPPNTLIALYQLMSTPE